MTFLDSSSFGSYTTSIKGVVKACVTCAWSAMQYICCNLNERNKRSRRS